MATERLILSNTKIILNSNTSELERWKNDIDYIFDDCIEHEDSHNVKIYLVDELENEDIFETVIEPLVNHFVEKLYSETYSSLIPHFMLYVATNKETYTADQLAFLDDNMVMLAQTFTDMPNATYLEHLSRKCSGAYIRFVINSTNEDRLVEMFQSVYHLYNLYLDVDWTDCDSIDFDIVRGQLEQYRDIIIADFDSMTTPLVPLNIENAWCKLILAHYAQSNDIHRTSPISQFSNREGTGNLGEYIIKDHIIYLNPYGVGDELGRICAVGETPDLSITNTIQTCVGVSLDRCSSCYLNHICNNGNPWINYLLTGEYNRMSECYCEWENMIMALSYDIICHFDIDQTNDLFKTYVTGATKRGIRIGY